MKQTRKFRNAALRGDAETLRSVWPDVMNAMGAPLSQNDLTLAILHCHRDAAEAMLECLRQGRKSKIARPFMLYTVEDAPTTGRKVKLLAAFHAAGYDLGYVERTAGDTTWSAFARKLIALSFSSHGALAAYQLEPDPADIIARPWWETFYGVNANAFRGDLKIWQRYVLPVLTFGFYRTEGYLPYWGLIVGGIILGASVIP